MYRRLINITSVKLYYWHYSGDRWSQTFSLRAARWPALVYILEDRTTRCSRATCASDTEAGCPRTQLNPLTPNDPYRDRTAPLTSKRCILYIYSTNTGTEYFKHGIYSPFFSSKCSLFHNSNVFGSCIIYILYTGVLKLKKNNSVAKRLNKETSFSPFPGKAETERPSNFQHLWPLYLRTYAIHY
jgi:hypothetical protein